MGVQYPTSLIENLAIKPQFSLFQNEPCSLTAEHFIWILAAYIETDACVRNLDFFCGIGRNFVRYDNALLNQCLRD